MEDLHVVPLTILALGVLLLIGAILRASIIERLERVLASNQGRIDELQNEVDELRGQVGELREALSANRTMQQEWINYARRLATLFREATGQEPPPEPEAQARTILPSTLGKLARKVEARFSLEEISNLAFDLDLDGVVAGDTIAARATSLVNAAKRRGLLLRLVELCRAERPEGGF